jgi:hypothetical protein
MIVPYLYFFHLLLQYFFTSSGYCFSRLYIVSFQTFFPSHAICSGLQYFSILLFTSSSSSPHLFILHLSVFTSLLLVFLISHATFALYTPQALYLPTSADIVLLLLPFFLPIHLCFLHSSRYT